MSFKRALAILIIYCATANIAIAQYIPVPVRDNAYNINLLFAGAADSEEIKQEI